MRLKKYLAQVESFLNTTASKFAFPIVLLFTIIFNLTLLQTYRSIPADEVNNAESAFSVYSGSVVPKFDMWSHIFPEAAVINFNYPPLYFYALGFWMKIVGFSPLASSCRKMGV